MADRRLRFVLPTRAPGKKITAERVVVFDEGREPTLSRNFAFDPPSREEIVRRLQGALSQSGWTAETDPAGFWTKSTGPYELRASYSLSEDRGTLFAEVPSHQYCPYGN